MGFNDITVALGALAEGDQSVGVISATMWLKKDNIIYLIYLSIAAGLHDMASLRGKHTCMSRSCLASRPGDGCKGKLSVERVVSDKTLLLC